MKNCIEFLKKPYPASCMHMFVAVRVNTVRGRNTPSVYQLTNKEWCAYIVEYSSSMKRVDIVYIMSDPGTVCQVQKAIHKGPHIIDCI